MDYPIIAEAEGIKIKPEKMEVEKLYYCIYQDKIMLFYKDQGEILNCYEVAEKDIVDSVNKLPHLKTLKIFYKNSLKKSILK